MSLELVEGRPTTKVLLAVLTLLLLTGGCAPAGQVPARHAADDFQSALRAGDTRTACALLSDAARSNLEAIRREPCEASLTALSLPSGRVVSVEVWGGNAQGRLDAGALFLAEFRSGWRVTATGCRPRPDQPYDCVLKG